MTEKKYDSKVCFQGKTMAQVRENAEMLFGDSFLCIEVDHHNMEFIVRVDHNIDLKRAEDFKSKHKQTKLIIYQEITLQALKESAAA